MNVLQSLSFSIINLTPPWFFNILNFSSWLWVQWLGSLALLFLIRTIYVFISTQIHFKKIKKTSFEELTALVKEKNIPFPKFTVVVPARNEAEVVEKTVIKLAELNYPKDRFEIVVITDEKETLYNKNNEITTQKVMKNVLEQLALQPVKVYHLDVPNCFDGNFHGKMMDCEIKSTKGRALNYAFTEMFEHFNTNTDFFAFFDTDDHPDKNCLIEIAKANINFPDRRVFQMPIFQCRNFWQISTFSKIIALGQSFTHEIFLPWIMTWLPFLGGTNLFIQKDVLFAVDGFNYHSITEDLDLGIAIYLRTNNWPHYLPYASTEQTPGNIKAFLKQRHRWALGQLEVIKNLKEMKKEKSEMGRKAKILYYKLNIYGPGEWTLFFWLTVLSVVILITRLFRTFVVILGMNGVLSSFSVSLLTNEILASIFTYAGMPMIIFALILLLHYNKFVEYKENCWKILGRLVKFILETSFIIPFLVILYPLPFFSAFWKYSIGYYKHRELTWVKTPRTKE